MDKIWLKNYPAGVPAQINPDEYPSLPALLQECCERYAGQAAYTSLGTTITYTDYERQARDFAAWLQNGAQLRKGDRIALMMPNVLQYPIALYGALRAGLIVVNTNPLYTPRELEHQLADSGAKAIVILENFAHTLAQVIDKTKIEQVIVTSVGDRLRWPKSMLANLLVRYVRRQVPRWELPGTIRFNAALAQGAFLPFDAVDLGHADIAFLQYTGGTTGVAKGAMLTQRNMIANVLQAASWLGTASSTSGGDTIITALPLYHIFALTANWMVFIKFGAHNVLIANPRDFPAFVNELKAHRFTYIAGVNTLFNALLHTPGFDEVDFSHLRITLGGGMAVQRSVAEHWKKVTGHTLTQAWGLTETSPAACINPFSLEYNGSIGLPIPSTEISIRDDGDAELAVGEIGEICVRGPQVMAGYWNRPDETAKVMLGDWLRTGDIGRIDEEGFVYIEDRKKDMILVSGFNVYPNEVESVAASHPGVLEVAAIAQPDERAGEVVVLFVVRKDPALTEQQVIDHCRSQLTGYKVPRHVYFRTDLPKTNVGKILRRALRDQLPKAAAA
jgi:long-chain acyl-CoA synthetase